MFKFISVIGALLLFVSCSSHIRSPADCFFSGQHPLLSLNQFVKTENKQEGRGSGIFFICVGGFNYSSSTTQTQEKRAYFSWLNNSGEYVMSDIPMNKVRFQIDSTVKIPYCKFRWYQSFFQQECWYNLIEYVVFVLRPDQIYNKTVGLDLK